MGGVDQAEDCPAALVTVKLAARGLPRQNLSL